MKCTNKPIRMVAPYLCWSLLAHRFHARIKRGSAKLKTSNKNELSNPFPFELRRSCSLQLAPALLTPNTWCHHDHHHHGFESFTGNFSLLPMPQPTIVCMCYACKTVPLTIIVERRDYVRMAMMLFASTWPLVGSSTTIDSQQIRSIHLRARESLSHMAVSARLRCLCHTIVGPSCRYLTMFMQLKHRPFSTMLFDSVTSGGTQPNQRKLHPFGIWSQCRKWVCASS